MYNKRATMSAAHKLYKKHLCMYNYVFNIYIYIYVLYCINKYYIYIIYNREYKLHSSDMDWAPPFFVVRSSEIK